MIIGYNVRLKLGHQVKEEVGLSEMSHHYIYRVIETSSDSHINIGDRMEAGLNGNYDVVSNNRHEYRRVLSMYENEEVNKSIKLILDVDASRAKAELYAEEATESSKKMLESLSELSAEQELQLKMW